MSFLKYYDDIHDLQKGDYYVFNMYFGSVAVVKMLISGKEWDELYSNPGGYFINLHKVYKTVAVFRSKKKP